jgi:hypothetical protein
MKTRRMSRRPFVQMCGAAVWVVALFMIWVPPVQASAVSVSEEPVDIEALGADVIPTEGVILTGGAESPDDTSWGVPVTVSPANGARLFHYPRTTTLIWRPVVGATSYVVERAYLSGATWIAYSPATVIGFAASSYTFNFVGDQPGRWRVRACARACTAFSAWKTFSYSTKPQLYTPLLTSPADNLVFDHYPRTLTLAWKPVVGAVGYKVERQYCALAGSPCTNYPPVTVTVASLTFNFIGSQPGKWRVTALGGGTYFDSAASSWRNFRFTR